MTDTIKTWQERTTHCDAPRHHDFYSCMMQAEIDELRAALAQLEQVRRETIEECAKVCADKSPAEYATGKVDHNEMAWVDSCAFDIRKLK